MCNLLGMSEANILKKRLVQPGQTIDVKAAFPLVRDMPYQPPSSRAPKSTVQGRHDTCSGNHYLLDDMFQGEGMESKVVICIHSFTEETTANYPPELREVVARGLAPDIPTYIRLKTAAGWTTVDAPWPNKAAHLRLTVNSGFKPGEDTALACNTIGICEVPEGQASRASKKG